MTEEQELHRVADLHVAGAVEPDHFAAALASIEEALKTVNRLDEIVSAHSSRWSRWWQVARIFVHACRGWPD